MKNKKISVKKTSKWKSIFIVLICIISLCISVTSFVLMMNNRTSIDTISQKVDSYTDLLDNNDDKIESNAYVEFCESVNSRLDSAITVLLSIVGIFASIITILGVLITFKAPKDMEKDIAELRELFEKTNDIMEEQEYLLQITDAVKEKTIYHRIKSLSNIIIKYPNRWQAYLYRGSEYDDKKEYDKAIKDYKASKEYGCEDEVYYNNMSIALSNRYKITNNEADQKQALELISKAIDINPENSSYYNNRGSIYDEMENYKLAKKDFETAISIDPENFEAYSNLAKLCFSMMRLADSSNEREELKRNAIKYIDKALELNYEDSDNLKQLSELLSSEHKSEEEINSIIGLLIRVNERSGDIDYEESEYNNAVSGYSKALSVFNGAPDEIIKNNIRDIERICEKIYKCKTNSSSMEVDNSLSRRLLPLISSITNIALVYYFNNEFSTAGHLYEMATILNGLGTVSSNNLAYMIRRGEYQSEKYTTSELLSCDSLEDSSSFIRINRALCHITGAGFKKDVRCALQEIGMCDDDLDAAIEWWGNEDTVGRKESNLVLVLLSLMDKLEFDEESCNINNMILDAINDGYDIPNNIAEIANDIKSGSKNN